jgi:hypothetical protein
VQDLGDTDSRHNTKDNNPGDSDVGTAGVDLTGGHGKVSAKGLSLAIGDGNCSADTCPAKCKCGACDALHAVQTELQQQRVMLDKQHAMLDNMHSMLQQLLVPARYVHDAVPSDSIIFHSKTSVDFTTPQHSEEHLIDDQCRTHADGSVMGSLCFSGEQVSGESAKE